MAEEKTVTIYKDGKPVDVPDECWETTLARRGRQGWSLQGPPKPKSKAKTKAEKE